MRAQLPEHLNAPLLSAAGVDCDTFPVIPTEPMRESRLFNRVAPLDPYDPQYPEAHRLHEASMDILMGQLDQAQPDTLGRRSACCITGFTPYWVTTPSDGIGGVRYFGGHSEHDIHDSLETAFGDVPEDMIVCTALSLVVGDAAKEKNAAPSLRLMHRLAPRLSDAGQLYIVQKENPDSARFIPAKQLKRAYRDRQSMPVINGETDIEAYVQAAHYTILGPRECELMAVLYRMGLGEGANLYLAGSGVGYGATAAVHPGQAPNDLDMIAIGPEGKEALEKQFTDVITAFYGSSFIKESKIVRQVGTGKLIEACILKNVEAGISIDLFAGRHFSDTLFRPETLNHNQMVQII